MEKVFEGQRALFYAIVGNVALVMEGWYPDKMELSAAIVVVEKVTGLQVKIVGGSLRACGRCKQECRLRRVLEGKL